MRRKGFTLIELLVVIAVIALLLAILTPALKKAKMSARRIICKSNLHTWGIAVNAYAQANNESLPRQDLRVGAGMNAWDVSPVLISYDNQGNFGFYQKTNGSPYQPCALYDYGIDQEEFVWCPLMAKKDYVRARQYAARGPENIAFNLWLGYNCWVPRGVDPERDGVVVPNSMFPFDYPETTPRTISWPTKTSSRGGSVYPILTDCMFRLNAPVDDLSDNPTAVSDLTRVTTNTIMPWEVYGLHVLNGLVRDTNLLFSDGHIEAHEVTDIRSRFQPTPGQYKNMY